MWGVLGTLLAFSEMGIQWYVAGEHRVGVVYSHHSNSAPFPIFLWPRGSLEYGEKGCPHKAIREWAKTPHTVIMNLNPFQYDCWFSSWTERTRFKADCFSSMPGSVRPQETPMFRRGWRPTGHVPLQDRHLGSHRWSKGSTWRLPRGLHGQNDASPRRAPAPPKPWQFLLPWPLTTRDLAKIYSNLHCSPVLLFLLLPHKTWIWLFNSGTPWTSFLSSIVRIRKQKRGKQL